MMPSPFAGLGLFCVSNLGYNRTEVLLLDEGAFHLRVIMAPIEMVAKFDQSGILTPVRFKYGDQVFNVDKVLNVCEEKLAGNKMKIFSCQSEIDGKLTRYEIKFELQTCKWFLYKM
jgi:hypothetical protein